MLAGQPPFTGPTATAILGKVVGENARPIVEHRRSVPPHVSDAIAKALEKLPADRWQSASEFVDLPANKRDHALWSSSTGSTNSPRKYHAARRLLVLQRNDRIDTRGATSG